MNLGTARGSYLILICGLVSASCSDDPGDTPALDAAMAADAGAARDGGPADAGPRDSGSRDAGQPDGHMVESMDAGDPDAGDPDAGDEDAGALDSGAADAGETDAGPADAGPPDSGPGDAGPMLSCAGRVAFWDFEEGSGTTVADGSGRGHDLTLTTSTWTTGTVGTGAANFTTAGAHGSTAGHADFHSARALTLTAWIQPSRVSGIQGLVVRGARAGAVQDWGFYLNGTELSALLNWPSAGGTLLNSTGAAITTGAWAFVAMVVDVDAGTISFYKDGTFVSSQPWTAPMVDNLAPVSVATDGGAPHDYRGDLDAVTVWTRALSATDIALMYADSTSCVAI